MKKSTHLLIGLVALPLFTGSAGAVPIETLSFYGITDNSGTGAAVAVGEAQFSVEVYDSMGGTTTTDDTVLMRFINSGSTGSIIREIYFDDGTLFGLSGLDDADDAYGASIGNSLVGDSGVDFTAGSATPPDLPAGNSISPAFDVTVGFLADADNPSGTNGKGIDPGEYLNIYFDLMSGQTISDLLAALDLDPSQSGSLRIGIHAGGFPGGYSESFINNPPGGGVPPQQIPEPATIALLGLGLAGFGFARRRRTA